ncbi:XrtA system polysaccharide chain length determinant [Allosphingosinicella humi]
MDGLYDQLRIALHSVWRRRWLALGVAWALCLLGWLAIALVPSTYESKAKVLAQMQTILPDKIGITPAERQADLLRVKQMLTSTENLQKVVRGTDLNRLVASDRDLAAQVAALRTNIKIVAQLDNVIEISATSGVGGFSNAENARTSTAIVQSLLDFVSSGNLAGDRAETGQTLAFLDAELKRREAQLQEAEQRRAEFEARYMGMLPGVGSIPERLSAARIELANIDRDIVTNQSALSSIRTQMAGIPATIAAPNYGAPGAGFASAQLAALEAQLSQAQARGWTDRHPDVVATKAEIARLSPQAARERASGGAAMGTPNPAYASLRGMAAEKEAQISAALARKGQIQAAMAQVAAGGSDESDVAGQQERLSRDYDVLKRQYDKLVEDREQVRLRADAQSKTDAFNFRIIEPPSHPTVPASPNRPLFLTLILLVAVAGGVAAAFAKGQLQPTFPSQAKLEQALGLPVLGAISEVVTADRRAERRQRLKWFASAGGALAASYALLMLVEFWQRSTVA